VSTAAWLAFTPRDTVFVRDGRSFDAAADATAQGVLPGPTTMAGAVGAAFGLELSRAELRAALSGGSGPRVTEEVRGPVLARRDSGGWEPYFPCPADLAVTADESEPEVCRLVPRQQPEGVTDLAMPRWLVPPDGFEDAEPLRAWIPGSVLAEYLANRLPAAGGSPLAELGPLTRGDEPPRLDNLTDPFRPEARVGLAREDRSVRAGFLYQATQLRFGDDWAFLAQYTVSEKWEGSARSHVPFGGKGRLADVEPAVADWPAPGGAGKRVLAYLATPAVWTDGWRLPLPDGAVLVAAATGDPQPAASLVPGKQWEQTRELRWVVPAGSVYLVEFPDDASGAQWARERHGRALPRGAAEPDLLRTAGFGVVLTGVWSD
jgi:CRISPR-associated protein Cmr3